MINNALAKDRGRVLFVMIIYRYRLIQLRTLEREGEKVVTGNRQLWVIVVCIELSPDTSSEGSLLNSGVGTTWASTNGYVSCFFLLIN